MPTEHERLVAEHAYLVEHEVARYRTWRVDRADLHQAGILGLLIAATHFDPDRAVPFGAYAHNWVRKEIQRAIAQQEWPTVVPADLIGRTAALRETLSRTAGRLDLAAAALGISPTTVAALHRQLDLVSTEDDEDLPAPGYAFPAAHQPAEAADFVTSARAALARMDPRQADALILRYGLDGGPERSYRRIGRHLSVSDHTARALVERAQAQLRRLIT
ncbi:MAG TPA: sigma-70 family RNA polymerase sigma factor [Pseudonocardiaceae bacterium]|jgi:RNA polymerase sigma factor (sigma-70 family)|nr:sigma-70 family RNA polymerase sigma factor [Pseudonocardiaceae bacterium]